MKSYIMEMLVEPRILILLISVIFCTGNAMELKKDKLASALDRLPELPGTTKPSVTCMTSFADTQNKSENIDQEVTHLVFTLYRDQHFKHLSELKKQNRKKNN